MLRFESHTWVLAETSSRMLRREWQERNYYPENYNGETGRCSGSPHYNWACADLAEKSRRLLMNEWAEHGHIHENYNAETGSGCDVQNSDKFYHWGALLAVVALIESGKLPGFDSEKGERK